MSIISAIILSGDRVAAAVHGSNAPSADNLSKLVDELKASLMPEVAEELEAKTEKMKSRLMKEVGDGGPLYIRAPKRKDRNRVVRRRRV